ncbi:MAG: DUF116 domain-containing protein [Methanosarcina sp.]|jgi:hypothetical protein|uniref:DUF116 domain-containing protein n=1 Tax=Methanosarcina sp. TaxID=2213 RepID=UPI002BCEECD7|nr:DUF116 domain-containing protein [Methanosarcina sp.]MDM7919085.1 DUF116 domain-containing protein [Methanosarcina sp.]HOW15308.1 DUF116 domain-containing protein [Methanosarcina sp.]
MYNLIGQALFISVVVSFTLSGVALLVSRRSLTRSVFLAGFYADVLDFFYLPLRQIFVKFSDTRILDKWMCSLKNRAHKSAFARTKRRIILAPHCMRSLDCPAYSTQTGIQCKSCGKCVFTRLKKDAEKYGYKVFIVTGSSFVKNILKMEAADGVLLIACDYEINKVMRALKDRKVVTYGVTMENDGCFGTEVDYQKVLKVFEDFKISV